MTSYELEVRTTDLCILTSNSYYVSISNRTIANLLHMFTLKEGFLEALVRGMKAELLVREDYVKLRQCDSLVDLKLYLVTQGEQSTLDMTNTRVGIERLSL